MRCQGKGFSQGRRALLLGGEQLEGAPSGKEGSQVEARLAGLFESTKEAQLGRQGSHSTTPCNLGRSFPKGIDISPAQFIALFILSSPHIL